MDLSHRLPLSAHHGFNHLDLVEMYQSRSTARRRSLPHLDGKLVLGRRPQLQLRGFAPSLRRGPPSELD